MILNNAKDINLGVSPVNKVFLGSRKIWERNSFEFMPAMSGITDYFDCRQGMTDTIWKNLAGGNDATWTGMEIQLDGSAGVYGTESSYGQFVSPYIPDRTVYTIFKTDPVGLAKLNPHIVGSCGGDINDYRKGAWFSISVEGYQVPDHITSDQWGIGIGSTTTSDTYHVAAVTRLGEINTLYVDGKAIQALSNNVAYSDNWGIGVLIDANGAKGYGPPIRQQIKFIAVGNEAHSAEAIKENSDWLIKEFISEVN